jgi:hypothetical protein
MGIESGIRASINEAFGELVCNIPTYDYWIARLYTPEGNMDLSNWTEENLREMKADAASLAPVSK